MQHVELRLPQCFTLSFVTAKVLIEIKHELRGCTVLQFPKGGDDTLCSRFNEGIDDVCHTLFAYGTDTGVAGRKCYQASVHRQPSNFAHLKKPIIQGRIFRSEDESRAVREFGIGVSVQSKMDDVVLAER